MLLITYIHTSTSTISTFMSIVNKREFTFVSFHVGFSFSFSKREGGTRTNHQTPLVLSREFFCHEKKKGIVIN